jgi:hypothetical protein
MPETGDPRFCLDRASALQRLFDRLNIRSRHGDPLPRQNEDYEMLMLLLSVRSIAPQGLLFALCFATDFGQMEMIE